MNSCSVLQYTPGKLEVSRRENRCILRIRNVATEDEGMYTCEVEGDETFTNFTTEGNYRV